MTSYRGEDARQEHQRVKQKAAAKGRTKHLTVRVKPELYEKIVSLQGKVARIQETHAPSLDSALELILRDFDPSSLAFKYTEHGQYVEPGHRLPRDVSASLHKVKG